VQSGSVSKHDSIQVLPADENGIVRSLQVMDDDVDIAVSGDRVGLAIRNLREEALHRGCMIVHADSNVLNKNISSTFTLNKAPFQKRVLQIGDVIHAAVDMQFIVGRIKNIEDSKLTVDWEIPLWTRKKFSPPIIITQLDAGPMRIIGPLFYNKTASQKTSISDMNLCSTNRVIISLMSNSRAGCTRSGVMPDRMRESRQRSATSLWLG
jgi:hypothetical protein